MDNLMIGSVVVAALIFGITQFLKEELGLKDGAVVVLVAVQGVIFSGLSVAISGEYIPPDAAVWIESIVGAIASILAAMGYYKLKTLRINKS